MLGGALRLGMKITFSSIRTKDSHVLIKVKAGFRICNLTQSEI